VSRTHVIVASGRNQAAGLRCFPPMPSSWPTPRLGAGGRRCRRKASQPSCVSLGSSGPPRLSHGPPPYQGPRARPRPPRKAREPTIRRGSPMFDVALACPKPRVRRTGCGGRAPYQGLLGGRTASTHAPARWNSSPRCKQRKGVSSTDTLRAAAVAGGQRRRGVRSGRPAYELRSSEWVRVQHGSFRP
jgi:hypothetical protein